MQLKTNLVLAMLMGFSANASGSVYTYWNGPECGDWWNASNWTQGVPTGGDCVPRFSEAGYPNTGTTIAITNAAAIDCAFIHVMDGAWSFNLRGTLSLPSEDVKNTPTVLVDKTARLTINGGVLDNVAFRVSTGDESQTASLSLENCRVKDSYSVWRGGVGESEEATYTLNGGVYSFTTWYPRLFDRMVIREGFVHFGSIHGLDRYGEGKGARCDSPLEVEGGRVVVDGEGQQFMSNCCGIRAKGRGVVDIRVGGNQVWLVNSAHVRRQTWRVEDDALFVAQGPYVVGASSGVVSTGAVEVAGGRFVMKSPFANWAGTRTGCYSSLFLDGGVLDLDYSATGTLQGTLTADNSEHLLAVGPSGGCLRNSGRNLVTVGDNGFVPASDAESDGGLTFDGQGPISLAAASTYAGGTTVRSEVRVEATQGAFGTGSVTLRDGGLVSVSKAETVLPEISVVGQGTLRLSSADATVTVPSLGFGEAGGVLVLQADTNYDKFGVERGFFSVETSPTIRADGLCAQPVLLSVPGYGNSAREVHLASWDAANGRFVGATYSAGWDDGESSVAYVTEQGNIDSDKHVGALVLRATINGMSAWNRIFVGNGTDLAYVCMNGYSNGNWANLANTRLVFGSSRGVIAVGNKVSGVDSGTCYINGFIDGTAGVTFVGLDGAGLRIMCPQPYSGGTKVLGGEIMLQQDSSLGLATFGDGLVEVVGGARRGGCVRFMATSTQTNDFVVSGFGAGDADAKRGALVFESDTTLSGKVMLANDALFCASNNATGVFTQTIDGTGDLHLSGAGTIALAGVDIEGDIHAEGTNVTTSGSLLTGSRFLFVDGTLTFVNDTDITVDAKVLGTGRIVLAGSGKVDFADLSVFEGVVDLAGQNAAVGAVHGISTFTNSSDTVAATLTVVGSTNAAWFGSFVGGVNLSVGGTFRIGATAGVPSSTDVILSGGELVLGEPTTVASLSGVGSVSGDVLAVTGATWSKAQTEQAIDFAFWPSLADIDSRWRLRRVGVGALLVRRRGTLVVVR